ncbi:MAG: transglutaminase family protein [Cyclobacteriaceae bacterium]|nr:transglutaminase family protein [Cyclobacteriaceae bacterium]MDH4295429.1 transglutaminase family protein [Cyclobacteriaceae bacterium]
MPIKVAIRHQTSYTYDRAVNLTPHTFRLKPAAHCRTPILSYSLKIKPEEHFLNWQQDPFGNFMARVVFPKKTTMLQFEVEVIAEIIVINPFDFFIEDFAENFPFSYTTQLRKELLPYFEISESGPFLSALLRDIDPTNMGMRTIDVLVRLNQEVQRRVNYTIRLEHGVQTCEQTLNIQSGSCRDSSWLLVQLFRHLGLAARFVSGYLIQLKADTKALDGPSGTAHDFTDLHAWAEVYIPGAGWVGLDPTSGLFAGEGHIPLCCTPDPVSAAPVTGMTDKCEVTFGYKNEVFRIHEDPRVTKPYSEEQWASIIGLGNLVDEHLQAGDVRLTMGGEPTFVSVDDMEAKEWNTAADGPQKRVLGTQLIRRLKNSFGPGGLIHKGQGKWYPGEPLPRWQYSAIWRNDGYPVWRNDALLDVDETASSYTIKEAHQLALLLTKFLNIPAEHMHPAVEDAFFFLWEESKVPTNIDPYQANLDDPLERKKLAELLANGLGTPVGYVIPVEWNYWNNQWLSGRWEFKSKHLILIPGNSPIGLRLPLKSLVFTPPRRLQKAVERSPFEELPRLGNVHEYVQKRYNQPIARIELPREFYEQYTEEVESDKTKGPRVKEPATTFEAYTVQTAVCIEVREGKIYIFMPPLQYAEHYLDMLASIEAAVEKLNIKVVIEGYQTPHDNRITKLGLSPDPGVLEVNIHPAKGWNELVNNYEILFEQARLSRLSSEKFMLDGKHTGTGGGNHITLGGITPADSPLLRRPDLLRSLITYWQHHPGLSYLFSSQFVGPTSQAPRVDEGRPEMLYELEIAFSQIPENEEVPFWLVDRIFRNLLIDITGNTHRAEFCIDKLYSPDGATGRLGILELRAFDMPPNKQMCIVQLLLLRSLVAWFWNKPYKGKLVRWGTALYDKFMLPHYVQQDLNEVTLGLQQAGYPFQLAWLEPFFEFRFPLYGKITLQDMELQLRMGIEPWHVLGEEVAGGSTARYVDSSVERLEVKVINFNVDRYMVTCNGMPVPLVEAPVKGEYVAGVRYRAWSPPSALHPTLGKDVPLVFDVVDTWNNRSVGGCTYHVAHPGGRNYDSFPVNAFEAEGRRISRFWNEGHTQGPITPSTAYVGIQRYLEKNQITEKFDPPPIKISPEYPNTLDLRRL